ncbi:hypothetical protein C8R44DRAFT_744581 [Mycena epipterygia]|nr:hypothetical protein C8R44DRAFT_744581 [Mycena epipterygia]
MDGLGLSVDNIIFARDRSRICGVPDMGERPLGSWSFDTSLFAETWPWLIMNGKLSQIRGRTWPPNPGYPTGGCGSLKRCAVTLFVRVYAIYNLSKRILCGLIISGTIMISVGAIVANQPSFLLPSGVFSREDSVQPSLLPCLGARHRNPGLSCLTIHCLGVAGAWELELACDVLVLGLILFRAFRNSDPANAIVGPLWRVMTRDGKVICLANSANLLMFYLGDIYTNAGLAWFTAQISVVMISRLMLNLHAAANPEYESTTHPIQRETVLFASIAASADPSEI